MADDKKQIIIVKKKKGGHAGAHGGAWKVAYADFVTAMMCFFLVMWLMGSDEEVKQAIANYFNNPTSAWRPDLASQQAIPLGNKTGAGENLLNGLDGNVPEAVVTLPSTQHYIQPEEVREQTPPDEDLLIHRIPDVDANVDLVKFSLPERVLFRAATDEFSNEALNYLDRVGKLLKKTGGQLTINGFTNPKPLLPVGTPYVDDYEFSTARVVAVLKYLTHNRFIDETHVSPHVVDASRNPASQTDVPKERILEFIVRSTQSK